MLRVAGVGLASGGKTVAQSTTALDLWEKVLEQLKRRIGQQRFALWFKNTRPVSFENDLLTVGVPNRFIQEWLQEHFARDLTLALRKEANREISLKFVIDAALFQEARREAVEQQASFLEQIIPSAGRKTSTTALKSSLSLENFVVGPCNELAYAAAKRVISQPGKVYNPLFIHGAVGLGKTHLLQGICHAVNTGKSNLRAIYISGEAFTNQFICSLRAKSLDAFRHRFREADVLIIDDVHFLANKEATQQEFLYTLNALDTAERQIVLASDSHPKMIKKLKASLVNRFVSGMVVRLEPPDFATRLEILRRKAALARKRIRTQVLQFVARRETGSVRDLEGALNILIAYASLTGGSVDITLARRALEGLHQEPSPEVNIKEVELAVCRHFGIEPALLKSPQRRRSISRPRQIAVYLARSLTRLSYAEIAEYFGRSNHAAAISAFRKISTLLKKDASLLETLTKLREELLKRNK